MLWGAGMCHRMHVGVIWLLLWPCFFLSLYSPGNWTQVVSLGNNLPCPLRAPTLPLQSLLQSQHKLWDVHKAHVGHSQQDKKKQPELCAGLRNGGHLEADGAGRSDVRGLQMRCLSLRLWSSSRYQQWQNWGESPAVNAKVEWSLPQSASEDAITLGGQTS